MPRAKKVICIVLFLLFAGVARVPLERPLAREMRASGILSEPLDMSTSEALGQTSAALALGGLRSLVAAVLNFSQVSSSWREQDWLGLFNTFDQIHTLQPRSAYYWEAAAGYAADDAYSSARIHSRMTPLEERQSKIQREEYFDKGIDYLDEGITNNPKNTTLRLMKARLYSETYYKPEQLDYKAAAEVLDEAITLDKVPEFLPRQRVYLMSRVPERREEALKLVREIYAKPESRFPSIKSLLSALQNEFPSDNDIPTTEIYASPGDAVRSLFNHYQRREEELPMTGVHEEIEEILAKIDPPYALNPLLNSDIKRATIKIGDALDLFPLTLPNNPQQDPGDWQIIVDHFQQYQSQSLPTFRVLFFVLQNHITIPAENVLTTSQIFPNDYIALRDLSNFYYDEGHQLPKTGIKEEMQSLESKIALPQELSPLENPSLFPLSNDWMDQVKQWTLEQINGETLQP